MNKRRCSKSTQRDLQRIRHNTQEECSRQFIPTRASNFRLITALICDPVPLGIGGIPYTKNRVCTDFGIEQEKLLWVH